MSQSLMTSLDLSSNLVSKIRVGAFNGLESLVSLSMRSNRIERLGEAVFTGKSQNFRKDYINQFYQLARTNLFVWLPIAFWLSLAYLDLQDTFNQV